MDVDGAPGAAAGSAWEQGLDETWKAVHEADDGTLDQGDLLSAHRKRMRRLRDTFGSVKRGMIRNLVVVIDTSAAMAGIDFRCVETHACVHIHTHTHTHTHTHIHTRTLSISLTFFLSEIVMRSRAIYLVPNHDHEMIRVSPCNQMDGIYFVTVVSSVCGHRFSWFTGHGNSSHAVPTTSHSLPIHPWDLAQSAANRLRYFGTARIHHRLFQPEPDFTACATRDASVTVHTHFRPWSKQATATRRSTRARRATKTR